MRRRQKRSNQRGSQLPEFTAAIVMLVFVVFIPMLDLIILPVRWILAHEIVSTYSRKLALCETFSEAYETMQADPSMATRLYMLGGVTVESVKMDLRVARVFAVPHIEEFTIVEFPNIVPKEWLPDGPKNPLHYTLELTVSTKIAPAVLLDTKGVAIPGLTCPVPITITASHEWENLGRNPLTGKYFLTE